MHNFKNTKKVGDWVVYCHICGLPCWGSEATKLGKYTGAEGAIVCPNDRDSVNYGLIGYKVPAEKSVPFVADSINSGTDPGEEIAPFDFSTSYPTESN